MLNIPLQDELAECGLVCLAVAAQSLGSDVELSSLRRRFPVSSRGMTLRDLRDVAGQMGMAGHAISCEIEELRDLKTPAILHWGFHHFVVLLRCHNNRTEIYDPAAGRRTVEQKELSGNFTGVAMELTPTQEFVKRTPPSELAISSWFRFDRQAYSLFAQVLLLSVLLQAYIIATPFYIQVAVDEAALKGDSQLLIVLAWGFALFAVFNAGATVLRGVIVARLTSMLSWSMTLRLFRHLIRLPLPWFQRRRLADILSRFDAIGPVRELVSGAIISTVVDGLLAVVTLVMMAMISAQLCVAAMAGLGIYMAIRIVALPLNIKLGSAAMMAKITETGVRIETVRAVQAIKVMGGENDRESRWAAAYRKSLRCDQNQTVANVSFATVQSLLDALLRILLTYLGVRGIMEGSLSIGVLYGFLSYQGQFSSKASALVDQYVRWRTTAMYSYRLSDIVLTQKERDIDRVQASSPAWGKIELRSLGFAYAEREAAVFANLSLSIDAGEFVAIVGPSGSGKSTLLKVICGLYPASSGEVLLDGRALSDWGPQAVRRCLGVVMQDDDLLSGSIAENVAFFDEKIDMERVWECLQHASISDDIRRMPLGIETLVGDMGAALSGGQKQRLLLARALYRRPRLLLLDEATSHVDSVCESAINDALKRLNITRIVVAHRAETIRAASRVIKLQGGRITFDSARRQDLTPIHANAGLPTGAQGATDRL